MKILVVGGGGREHALCWKLHKDAPSAELHCAPGNPGIEELAICHAVDGGDIQGLTALARTLAPDFVVVGPETPLAKGLADLLRAAGIPVFGPSAAAARLESSKVFAKSLMHENGIPTARSSAHTDSTAALSAANALVDATGRAVVKASGLAAGKGVIICESRRDAAAAVAQLMTSTSGGTAGDEVVVEEFMAGVELSLFAVCDGSDAVLLLPSRDHKRLLNGDQGPNTGGMGVFAPVSEATPELIARARAEIIVPTLAAMGRAGTPFTGLLYAGLMITPEGDPKVVEFNCRFGDPETQVVLPLMTGNLLELLHAVASGRQGALAAARDPEFSSDAAVTVVMANKGYPAAADSGADVRIPKEMPNHSFVFHAGTSRGHDGRLLATGGRVLAVTSLGATVSEARARSLQLIDQIEFAGAHWRTDIGGHA